MGYWPLDWGGGSRGDRASSDECPIDMPELRKDPIVDRWVIVAPERAARPHDFAPSPPGRSAGPCPFCEGNEAHTPGEIAAVRDAGSAPDRPGWRVRVVPNKFPALVPAEPRSASRDGMFERSGGFGVHEVIVESPRHVLDVGELSVDQLCEVLSVYVGRVSDLKHGRRLRHAMIFKNVGAAAGASLEHVHSQLIAMPIVPVAVADELRGSHDSYRSCGRCVFCQMIDRERAASERVVCDGPHFVAVAPFAGRVPYETWILPTVHRSHFEQISPDELADLSRTMRCVAQALRAVVSPPAYNLLIHSAPFDTQPLDHYHWHIEIIPRSTQTAGFEWGSGFYINTLPPEQAAERLRTAAAQAR